MMYKNSADPGNKARIRKEKEKATQMFAVKVASAAEKNKDAAKKKTEDKD